MAILYVKSQFRQNLKLKYTHKQLRYVRYILVSYLSQLFSTSVGVFRLICQSAISNLQKICVSEYLTTLYLHNIYFFFVVLNRVIKKVSRQRPSRSGITAVTQLQYKPFFPSFGSAQHGLSFLSVQYSKSIYT